MVNNLLIIHQGFSVYARTSICTQRWWRWDR